MSVRKEHFTITSVWLVAALAVLTSGCATKRYVRDRVDESSTALTAAMDQKDQSLRQSIEANSNQIEELGSKTATHDRQIETLDAGLKATDQKAGQALGASQTAQATATQASAEVNRLETQYKNRNHHATVTEERLAFATGSSTVRQEHLARLDQIAQQVKSNADALLILEGRTDSTGDANYNVRLGERRIDSVVRYLVVDKEVPMQQVRTMSYGEAKPIATNETQEGRAQNRAVVIRVLAPGQQDDQMSSAR